VISFQRSSYVTKIFSSTSSLAPLLCFNAKHLCSLAFILWDGNGLASFMPDLPRQLGKSVVSETKPNY